MWALWKQGPTCKRFSPGACRVRSITFFEGALLPDAYRNDSRGPMRFSSFINVSAFVVGAAAIAAGAAGCTVQHPEPNLAGQDVHVTFVHTADLHSRFYPYYFAPGQIDKGLGLMPKAGQDFVVTGGIGRASTAV